MKKTHGFGTTPKGGASDSFGAADKKKLIIMGGVLIFVAIGYFASVSQQKKYEEQEGNKIAREQPAEEQIFIPEFDLAALNGPIDDSEQGQLRVEDVPLGKLLDHTSLLTGLQYDALGTIVLDGEASAKLIASPKESRGQAVRARGTIESLITRNRNDEDGGKFIEGRLRLEDESVCYFALSKLPIRDEAPAATGSFVRINGLFMKARRVETDNGWETGPYIVGRNAVFSYETVGEKVTSLPPEVMALVEDDSVMEGPQGQPFSAYWTLLAYARDLEEGDIDWATVPELDSATLGEIFADGQKFRAKPFRIPVSVNLGSKYQTIAENPARLETVSEGWIGNQLWSAGNGVIKFIGPFGDRNIARKNLVTARGFFFRNHLYEPRDGGAALAPLFVLVDIEKFVPGTDERIPVILAGVFFGTIALLGLLMFLLMRDKKKSQQLQADLVRRKRERRERQAGNGTASPGQA